MAAMEKGIPLPELPLERLKPPPDPRMPLLHGIVWLAFGIGGVGALAAIGPVETKMWTERGAGPRGTPTVDGDRLYVLTENGDLACLKTDGTAVWQRNILKDFGGQ